MQANKSSLYQTCYQCGFKNKTAATQCQICESKLKPLLPYKQALTNLSEAKFSPTSWALAGILGITLTAVNVYCVVTAQSCDRVPTSTDTQK